MLRRYWFEFDLAGPERPARPGTIDGGSIQYSWLSRGAGVSGIDRDDCLALLEAAVGAELPPVAREVPDVTVDHEVLGIDGMSVGNPAWRGVWWPPLNLTRPTT